MMERALAIVERREMAHPALCLVAARVGLGLYRVSIRVVHGLGFRVYGCSYKGNSLNQVSFFIVRHSYKTGPKGDPNSENYP